MCCGGAQNYSGPYVHGSGPPGGYDEEATAWAAYHEYFQARTSLETSSTVGLVVSHGSSLWQNHVECARQKQP